MKFKKHFTPQEANDLLPQIKRIVQLVLSISREYYALSNKVETIGGNARLEGLQTEFQNFVRELESIGCIYKGVGTDSALVDFPSVISDEEVFLCWKSDEDRISYFHPIETGFAGREEIPEDEYE